jgi:hypothetical protein
MNLRVSNRLCSVLLLPLVALSGATVLADTAGKPGRITQMRINAQASTEHASFHGRVTLRRPGSNTSENYHWGGSMCPGQRLSDAQVAILVSAMQNRTRTMVAPHYLEGEGTGTKCLVAFDLVGS